MNARIFIKSLFIFFIAITSSYAALISDFYGYKPYDDSYVHYSNGLTISSAPNSFWVEARNGDVPFGAVIYKIQNGYPAYYCRALYDNKVYYGFLSPRNGCIIVTENGSTLRFIMYEVFVAN